MEANSNNNMHSQQAGGDGLVDRKRGRTEGEEDCIADLHHQLQREDRVRSLFHQALSNHFNSADPVTGEYLAARVREQQLLERAATNNNNLDALSLTRATAPGMYSSLTLPSAQSSSMYAASSPSPNLHPHPSSSSSPNNQSVLEAQVQALVHAQSQAQHAFRSISTMNPVLADLQRRLTMANGTGATGACAGSPGAASSLGGSVAGMLGGAAVNHSIYGTLSTAQRQQLILATLQSQNEATRNAAAHLASTSAGALAAEAHRLQDQQRNHPILPMPPPPSAVSSSSTFLTGNNCGAARSISSSTAPPQDDGLATADMLSQVDESNSDGRVIKLLYTPADDTKLSPYQCLARKQIEVFSATTDDLEAGAQGRNRPIKLHQVGIRCRWCATVPSRQRHRASAYYPSQLSGIYQAAQNIANTHISKLCQCVPLPIRQELLRLQMKKSGAGGGKKYWSSSAEAKGLCNLPEGGLALKDAPGKTAATTTSTESTDRTSPESTLNSAAVLQADSNKGDESATAPESTSATGSVVA